MKLDVEAKSDKRIANNDYLLCTAFTIYTFDKQVYVKDPSVYGVFTHYATGKIVPLSMIYSRVRTAKDSYGKVVAKRKKLGCKLHKIV